MHYVNTTSLLRKSWTRVLTADAEIKHKRVCDGLIILFILAILTFGLIRATNEYRWSGWAPGDAQTLAAARHFADEGFIENRFLTYYHPGYIRSIYTGEEVYSFLDGYYTHSPPFYALVNGLIIKAGGDHYECQAFSVFLSVLALLFFYIFACYFFKRPVALICTLVIGLSVVFLEHMDGLSPQTYDVFLVSAAMALFAAAHRDRRLASMRRLKTLALVGVWLLVFLQAFNSFEYILFLQLFIIGYYFLSKTRPFPFKTVAIFIAAPVTAFALHFAQVAWARGGLTNAWQDVLDVLGYRTIGQGGGDLPSGLFPLSLFGVIDNYFFQAFGIGIAVLFLLFIFVRFIEFYNKPGRMFKFERSFSPTNVLIWLGVCFLAWRIAVSKSLEIYHPEHAFVFVGLLFGLMVTLYLTNVWSSFHNEWSGRHASALSKQATHIEETLLKFGITSLIIVIPVAAFLTNSIGYMLNYPNEISPERTWGVHVSLEELEESFEVAQEVKERTNYGDIVFHNLGNEWQRGAEAFPLLDEYMQRRGMVLGQSLQETKVVPLVNGNEQEAYEKLQPSYARFYEGELLIDGLPDDGYLYTYITEEQSNGIVEEMMAGIKNFDYRLSNLRELRGNLIESGAIEQNQIRYFALLSEKEASRPLGKYLLTKYHSEKLTPNYTLVHLDILNDLSIPLPDAYWPLDMLPGTKAWDISGWDRHLLLNGSFDYTEEGKVDSALKFNGNTTAENKLFGLYLEDGLTLSFWIYPLENNNESSILSLGNNENKDSVLIGYDSLHPQKLMVKVQNVTLYSNSDLPPDVWSHVTVTLNQTTQTISIYLNGVLDSELTPPESIIHLYINNEPEKIQTSLQAPSKEQFLDFIKLGASFAQSNRNFTGQLDEVAVFSQVLTPLQIETLNKQGIGIDKSRISSFSIEQIVYSGDVLNAPDWINFTDMSIRPDFEPINPWHLVGTFDTNAASNGILTIKTSGGNAGQFTHQEDRFANDKGLTAEIKIKITEVASSGFQGACFAVQNGSREAKITFYPDHISIRDQNDEKATYSINTGDAFHIYRLSIVKDKADVYVDDEYVLSITLTNSVSYKAVIVGDLSAVYEENISAEIDYIIYSVDEALAPVPRPVSTASTSEIPETSDWNTVNDISSLLNESATNPWNQAGSFNIKSASNNVLTVRTIGSNIGYFGCFDQDLNNSAGSTAEFTFKLLGNSPDEDNSFTFSIHDGTRGGSVVIHPDYISILDSKNEIATYAMDTTTDFHAYRLALVGDIFNVYVDGKSAAQIAVSDFVPTKVILWGDISSETGRNMHAQVSYLAYTHAGALTPEGEPVEPLAEPSLDIPGMGNVTKLSDMRVLPDSEQMLPWTSQDSFDIKQVLNGILTLKTSGTNAAWFVLGDERFNNTSGTTVEFKIKVIEASSQGFQGDCLYLQDGVHEAKVTLYPDRIAIRDQNDEKATHLIDTTDGFHTYRLAMIRDSLNVYVDGKPVASVSLENRISSKGILIGDLSTDEGENIYAEIDYIAYQCDSALAPDGIAITSQTSSVSPPLPSPEPSLWTKFSEMNDPPSREDEPWGIWGTFDINNTSEGTLTIKTSGANAAWIGCGEDRLNDTKGTTVETRLKLLNAESRGFQGACLYVQDGTHEAKITFWPNFIIIRDQNDARAYYGMNTLDGFHVYRITMKGNKVDVYVDGSYVATISLANQVSGRGIVLGDLSTEEDENVHAEVDYIAYSADGAFSPAELPSPISNGESSK